MTAADEKAATKVDDRNICSVNYVTMATHVLSKNDDSINPVRKTDERGKSNRVNNGFVPMDRPDSRHIIDRTCAVIVT
jgi:hypothetical protein